jgi:hypothetical protein
VTHEGVEWADERGIHRPKRAAAATEASAAGKPDQPDPQRRLTALQALGGKATRIHGKWSFTKINELTAREKSRPRSDQKTIRRDLVEAAEAEHKEGQKPTRPSMFPT